MIHKPGGHFRAVVPEEMRARVEQTNKPPVVVKPRFLEVRNLRLYIQSSRYVSKQIPRNIFGYLQRFDADRLNRMLIVDFEERIASANQSFAVFAVDKMKRERLVGNIDNFDFAWASP